MQFTNNPGSNSEGSLLFTLEEISQLVSHSHDSAETLDNIVRLIQHRFHVAVCSFYLYQPDTKELVLAATLGLRPEVRGRLRMKVEEGLTGLVAQQLSPVMVADAPKHPRFKYFPDAGEETYQAFLGVPLVETGVLKGVLVVQTVESRVFSPSEIRMLVAVGAQVAPLVGDAILLERVAASLRQETQPAQRPPTPGESRQGTSLSGGTGMGLAYLVDEERGWSNLGNSNYLGSEKEKQRLNEAMAAARDDLSKQSKQISDLVGESHGAILQAQQMLLQDNSLVRELGERIERGINAESALQTTLEAYVKVLSDIRTPLVQERIYDIKDVFHRILWHLKRNEISNSPNARGPNLGKVVIVCRESSVMELFAVDLERLAGIVVERGGSQSHAAILARSLGIPMVSGFPDFTRQIPGGTPILVDGDSGRLVVDPPSWMLPNTAQSRDVPAPAPVTESDSRCPVPLDANINFLAEATQACQAGAEGVGLFRSEFLFIARRNLPTEEEQVAIYRKLLEAMRGKPVTIRTFDLRPDKVEGVLNQQDGGWQALDWRDVLISTSLQGIFQEQIRAIFRASPYGKARLLVPLVTTTELMNFILDTIEKTKKQLTDENLPFDPNVPLGIMIEAASSAMMIGDWASSVDFFTLGTNDLTASSLGIDRDSQISSQPSHRFNPGVLRMVHHAIQSAKEYSKPVVACGELATEPMGYWLLISLGISRLSVPVRKIKEVHQLAGRFSTNDAEESRKRILSCRDLKGLNDCFREFHKPLV